MTLKTIIRISLLLLVLSPQPIVGQDAAGSLSALFDTLHARRNFDGCVLIASGDKILLDKAYGYADEESRRLLNTESVFELASVSKQFTAMAIMQLKSKGALDYSDPVQKFFPFLPYKDVTVRDLLVHTAGIRDFLGWGEEELDVSRVNTNADILKKLPQKYPSTDFPAGSRFGYSNTNYVLLACIVEKLSGIGFAEYLEKHVFQPAGMRDTRVYSMRSSARKIENYAYGYLWEPTAGKFVSMDSATTYAFHMDGIYGPYGISSNVHDLYQWDQALYTKKLLSQADLREAFQPSFMRNGKDVVQTPMGLISGFGWQILPDSPPPGTQMFHSGGYGGYSNLIVRNTDKKQTVILLSNHKAMADIFSIMSAIDEILNGGPVTIPDRVVPQKGVPTTAAQLEKFNGIYAPVGEHSYRLRVRNKGNQLYIRSQDQIETPVYAALDGTFFYSDVDTKIRFSKDASGEVNQLTITTNQQEINMQRIK